MPAKETICCSACRYLGFVSEVVVSTLQLLHLLLGGAVFGHGGPLRGDGLQRAAVTQHLFIEELDRSNDKRLEICLHCRCSSEVQWVTDTEAEPEFSSVTVNILQSVRNASRRRTGSSFWFIYRFTAGKPCQIFFSLYKCCVIPLSCPSLPSCPSSQRTVCPSS